MKYRLTVAIYSMWLLALQAQPVMKAPPAPEPGDTLFYFTDDLPKMIDVRSDGPDQFWNYAFLKAPYIEFNQVEAAASGKQHKSLPESELMIVNPQGQEEYYAYDDQWGLTLLGGNNLTLGSGSINNRWSLDNGLPLEGVKLNYTEEMDVSSTMKSKVSINRLSTDIQQALGKEVDTVMIQAGISRNIVADAWGRLQIPGGAYDVIRYRVTDLVEYDISTKSAGAGWIDVEVPNTGEFATRTMVSFHYISDQYAQPVASVQMNPNGNPGEVRYMADPLYAYSYKTATPGQWLYAYPNPALSVVRFKLFDVRPGKYQIRFYNILGKLLFEESYEMDGEETIDLNIAQLQRGTYLYSLVDSNGNKLITKRLAVLKP